MYHRFSCTHVLVMAELTLAPGTLDEGMGDDLKHSLSNFTDGQNTLSC